MSLTKLTASVSITYILISEVIIKYFYQSPILVNASSISKYFWLLFLLGSVFLLFKNPIQIKQTNSFTIKNKSLLILLASLTFAGFILRFHKIDNHNFYEDEFQVIEAAKCYEEIGQFCYWDWISDQPQKIDGTNYISPYTRAWPHSWMVALSFRLFGVNELSARLPSLIFGTILIPLSYLTARILTKNQLAALLTAVFITFEPSLIFLSRYVRMYAIMIPIFIGQTLLVYRLLAKNSTGKQRLLLAAVLIITTILNASIHINSLIIAPAILFFLPIGFLSTKNKTYLYYLALGVVGLIGVILVANYLDISLGSELLTFLQMRNFQYLSHFFEYPLTTKLGFGLALIGSLYAIKTKQLGALFLSSLVFFSLFFFIFIANRYDQFNYSSHLHVLAVILSIFGLVILLKHLGTWLALGLATVLAVSLVVLQYQSIADLYVRYNGRPDYETAYSEIIAQYDDSQHALWLQFPRTYYLQDLAEVDIINLRANREYTLEMFLEDYDTQNKSGWISWSEQKSGHIDDELKEYIDNNFTKTHGSGVDESSVSVYKLP